MKKTVELKNALTEMYNKRIWNKYTEIDGKIYIYNSARNEFRVLVNQPSGTIAALVGCMTIAGFFWCC